MQQKWSKVWFIDEKKWCLDGPNKFGNQWHYLRKEPHSRLIRQAGGGSLMVWAGICNNKKIKLIFCNNIVDSN